MKCQIFISGLCFDLFLKNVREARTFQEKLHASKPNNMSDERFAKTFAKHVLEVEITQQ